MKDKEQKRGMLTFERGTRMERGFVETDVDEDDFGMEVTYMEDKVTPATTTKIQKHTFSKPEYHRGKFYLPLSSTLT